MARGARGPLERRDRGRHRRIGTTIVEGGFLEPEMVEAEARAFHDDLEVVEVIPRSEAVTVPPPYRA